MKRMHLLIMIVILAGCGGGIVADSVNRSEYDSLIQSGWEKYNQALYEEASQLFIAAKRADSERPEGYIGWGWSLLRKQHPDSAIVVFRNGFDYITSLTDSVDAITGLAGSYLAYNANTNVVNMFAEYPVSSVDDGFPLEEHDFFLGPQDLEIVQSMALYRLGLYSSGESPDPNNAVYHLNQVLLTPHQYTGPQAFMHKMMDYLNTSGGGIIQ